MTIMHKILDVFKKRSGLSLVELVIVLGLLSVVLSAGYMFFNFVYSSFFTAEGRSDVQQNVRIVSDFISKEIRNATSVKLLGSSETIPDPSTLKEDEHYIFVNADGKIEYRTKNVSRIIPDIISERINFTLDFSISTASDRILRYDLGGIRDSDHTFSLSSEVFIQNLAFQNKVIATATTGTDYTAVYFIKKPATVVVYFK